MWETENLAMRQDQSIERETVLEQQSLWPVAVYSENWKKRAWSSQPPRHKSRNYYFMISCKFFHNSVVVVVVAALEESQKQQQQIVITRLCQIVTFDLNAGNNVAARKKRSVVTYSKLKLNGTLFYGHKENKCYVQLIECAVKSLKSYFLLVMS